MMFLVDETNTIILLLLQQNDTKKCAMFKWNQTRSRFPWANGKSIKIVWEKSAWISIGNCLSTAFGMWCKCLIFSSYLSLFFFSLSSMIRTSSASSVCTKFVRVKHKQAVNRNLMIIIISFVCSKFTRFIRFLLRRFFHTHKWNQTKWKLHLKH